MQIPKIIYNESMKKLILLFSCLFLFVTLPTQAQLTTFMRNGSKVSSLGRFGGRGGAVSSRVVVPLPPVLPPTPGTVVQYPFVPAPSVVFVEPAHVVAPNVAVADPSSLTVPNISASLPKPTDRSWIEQLNRNIKAAQLKRKHAESVRLAQAKANLPKLAENYQREVPSFEGLEVHGEKIPDLPWLKEDGILFRGMGLPVTGQEIQNILENGLLIKDVGTDNGTLVIILSGGVSRSALANASHPRFTNLTNSPQDALHYAVRNNGSGNVIVLVRVSGQSEYLPVVRVDKDIAPEHIEEMIALLSVDGAPTWCRITQSQGKFIITPYKPVQQ